MSKSTHKVEVVPVVLEPHPNADKLSIVHVYGYPCIVQTEAWANQEHKYGFWGTIRYFLSVGHLPPRGPLWCYIPPDSICPDTEQFKFLDGHMRIKAKKLRGMLSMGLLMPAPAGSIPGDDVAKQLGIVHYEPAVKLPPGIKLRTDTAPSPPGYHPVYDVDALRRYRDVFEQGESVWVSEKIHGTSSRFTYIPGGTLRDGTPGVMHVGSHNQWRKYDIDSLYWKVLAKYPEIEEWCRSHPGFTLYGEIYGGGIQKGFDYGTKSGDFRLALFDVLDLKGNWLDPALAYSATAGLPWVPLVGEVQYDFDTICAMAEGPSLVPGAEHIREGVVCKPVSERTHPKIGRVNLKLVSSGYYMLKDSL